MMEALAEGQRSLYLALPPIQSARLRARYYHRLSAEQVLEAVFGAMCVDTLWLLRLELFCQVRRCG